MSLSGTTQLVEILSQISRENDGFDIDYLDYFVYLEDDTSVNFYTYFNDAIFYFDFKDRTPFSLTYQLENGDEGRLLFSPYIKDGNIDYTVKIVS